MEMQQVKDFAKKAGAFAAVFAFLIWLFSPTHKGHNRK